MANFPKIDFGLFHLTPSGWQRQDCEPFPADRMETWRYRLFCQAVDAKERVSLTRIWTKTDTSRDGAEALHRRFGEPLAATPERNVMLECDV